MSDSTDEGPKELGNYRMGKILGEGAFSKVKLGTHKDTGLQVAVKIVDKEMIQNIKDLERVMREMHVLKNIIHPNIIRLHEVMEKGARLFLVLDFASGGELYDYVIDKGALPEKQARTFFGQVLSGVDFFHRQHVSHRDLKPENVLMVDPGNGSLVCKIADFGLSNDMLTGTSLKTICGTPAYAAPEITLGQKRHSLRLRESIRAVSTSAERFKRIQNGTYAIPSHCSPELADLIRRFMDVSPQKRITTAQAWLHPWLSSLNNHFLDLDLDVDDDMEEALEKEAAEEAEASAVEAGGGGRMIGGVAFPPGTLELLGSAGHLPPACTEAAVQDESGVSFLVASLAAPVTKEGGGEGDTSASKSMALCYMAKKKDDAAPDAASPVKAKSPATTTTTAAKSSGAAGGAAR